MRIKVCFIVLGIDFSGAENVLVQYLNKNEEIDPYFAVIYCGSVYEKFKNLFGDRKTICLNVKYSKNELRFLPVIAQRSVSKELKKAINNFSPDVLYVNNTLEIVLCEKAIKQCELPVIGHIHDMKNSLGSPIKVIEAKKAFECFDKLVTVSNACKSSWNRDDIEVVYNGVPDNFFKKEFNKQKKISIGYVGMLSQRKGFDILFDAIKNLPSEINWEIAYNIVDKKFIHRLNELNDFENVNLHNNIPNEKMAQFYDEITLLVIPSREDPLPTVAIEAMARGKIVIGFNIGGIPELIGDSELIVNEITTEAFIKKINQCIEWSKEYTEEKAMKLQVRSREMFNQANKKSRINEIIKEITVVE